MMFDEIFKAFNDFFNPEYIDITPEIEKGPLFEKVKKMLEKSLIFEQAKNYKTTRIHETIPSIFKLFFDITSDQDFLDHTLLNLKKLSEDEGDLVKTKSILNYLIFSSVKQPIDSLVASNRQSLVFFTEYLDFVESHINVNEIISSLNFINEEKQKLALLTFTKPLSEVLKSHNWMFFDKIKKSSKGQYRMYFNDWTLKNSQIMEYSIKSIFKLFLQLDLIQKGASEDDIKELIQYNDTLGKIIHYFDPTNKFLHLQRLRIYRNAVFHPGADFRYNPNEDLRKLTFEDDYGEFEVTIDGFIKDFRKILIFITTINFWVANVLFKAENDGKTIFQMNYEYAKNHGMKEFWKWITIKMGKNRYFKYFLI